MDGASEFISVDGIRTHYWSAGPRDAPAVVLLHGGEFGGSAELSWERNIGALASSYRVVAPDMLGFGLTDKIFEFGLSKRHARRIWHIRRLLDVLLIDKAHFIGNSTGGWIVFLDQISDAPKLPAKSIISICGAPPDNAVTRDRLTKFDGTRRSMVTIVETLFHDPSWISHTYIDRRMKSALQPGAYEAAAAARLRLPSARPPAPSHAYPLAYSRIAVPTLFVSGAHDRCCPLWPEKAAGLVPGAEFALFEHSAHCPHLEEADRFNKLALDFLTTASPKD